MNFRYLRMLVLLYLCCYTKANGYEDALLKKRAEEAREKSNKINAELEKGRQMFEKALDEIPTGFKQLGLDLIRGLANLVTNTTGSISNERFRSLLAQKQRDQLQLQHTQMLDRLQAENLRLQKIMENLARVGTADSGHSCSNLAEEMVTKAALPYSIGVEIYRRCLNSLTATLDNSFRNNVAVQLSDETKFCATGLATAMARAKQIAESARERGDQELECHVAALGRCENDMNAIRQTESEIEIQIGANDRNLTAAETAVRSATNMYETAQRALRDAGGRKKRFVWFVPLFFLAAGVTFGTVYPAVVKSLAEKESFLAKMRSNFNEASRRLDFVRNQRAQLQQQRRQIQLRREKARLENQTASAQLANLRDQQTKMADLTERLKNLSNYLTKMVVRTTILKENIVEKYIFDLETVAAPIREIADLFAAEMRIPSNPWLSRLSNQQIRSIRGQLASLKRAQERQQNAILHVGGYDV